MRDCFPPEVARCPTDGLTHYVTGRPAHTQGLAVTFCDYYGTAFSEVNYTHITNDCPALDEPVTCIMCAGTPERPRPFL